MAAKGTGNEQLTAAKDAENRRATKRRPRKGSTTLGREPLGLGIFQDRVAQREEKRAQMQVPQDEHAVMALELIKVLCPTLTGLPNKVAAVLLTEFAIIQVAGNESLISAAIHAMRLKLTHEEANNKASVDLGITAARNALRRAHNRLLQPTDAPFFV